MRKIIFLNLGCILFFFNILLAQPSRQIAFQEADEMPYFKGCDAAKNSDKKRDCSNQQLITFISENLRYPADAQARGIEGTVVVSFVINEAGKVEHPTIQRDIGGGCGEAALSIVRAMPDWEAGLSDGKPVKIELQLPVHFSLATPSDNRAGEYQIYWGGLVKNMVSKESLLKALQKPLYVRDVLGNNVFIDELVFSYEKGNKEIIARSRGNIDKNIIRLIEKMKADTELKVMASVQESGAFYYVERFFEVVK